jgi:hypothetical protein
MAEWLTSLYGVATPEQQHVTNSGPQIHITKIFTVPTKLMRRLT